MDYTYEATRNRLLQSTPENLDRLCRENQDAQRICKSVDFWETKMRREGLPIGRYTDLSDLINQYKIRHRDKAMLIKYLNELKEFGDTDISTILTVMVDNDLRKNRILPSLLINFYAQFSHYQNMYEMDKSYFQIVYVKSTNKWWINGVMRDKNGNNLELLARFTISEADLVFLILNLIYEHIVVYDMAGDAINWI